MNGRNVFVGLLVASVGMLGGCFAESESDDESVDMSANDVEQVLKVCPGDYLVTDSASALKIRFCSKIEGSLTISGASVYSFVAPWLTSIGSNLSVVDTNIEALSIPYLQSVGGAVLVDGNLALKSIALNSLVSVTGQMKIDDDAQLNESISLPILSQVGGSFLVKAQRATSLLFPELVRIGGNAIPFGQDATSISFPKLTELGGSLSIGDLNKNYLQSFSAPLLARIPGTFSVKASVNVSHRNIDLRQLSEIGAVSVTSIYCVSYAFGQGVRVLGNLAIVGGCNDSFPVSSVGGNVQLKNASTGFNGSISIALPNLTSVGGSVSISEDSGSYTVLKTVNAPILSKISGDLVVSNTQYLNLSLGELANVGGSVSFSSANGVDSSHLKFGKLVTVGQDLKVYSTDATSCDFLSKVTTAGRSVLIAYNKNLASLKLTSLSAVGGTLSLHDNALIDNTQEYCALAQQVHVDEATYCSI